MSEKKIEDLNNNKINLFDFVKFKNDPHEYLVTKVDEKEISGTAGCVDGKFRNFIIKLGEAKRDKLKEVDAGD